MTYHVCWAKVVHFDFHCSSLSEWWDLEVLRTRKLHSIYGWNEFSESLQTFQIIWLLLRSSEFKVQSSNVIRWKPEPRSSDHSLDSCWILTSAAREFGSRECHSSRVVCFFVNAPSEQAYPEIYRLFPSARIQHIDGAGHWVHAEKPHQFLTAVESFLSSASDSWSSLQVGNFFSSHDAAWTWTWVNRLTHNYIYVLMVSARQLRSHFFNLSCI